MKQWRDDLENDEVDIFINITGTDEKWLKTLKVEKDQKTTDIYNVSWVIPAGADEKATVITIEVQLIKTSSDILIDAIKR